MQSLWTLVHRTCRSGRANLSGLTPSKSCEAAKAQQTSNWLCRGLPEGLHFSAYHTLAGATRHHRDLQCSGFKQGFATAAIDPGTQVR